MTLPTNEVVMVAWLKALPNIPSDKVATVLPVDNSVIAPSGFITTMVAGGEPHKYVPRNSPVYEVNCWAVNPNSEKPPWGKANNLAEIIKESFYDQSNFGHLTTPSPFENVRTMSGYLLNSPKRVPEDEGRFARYTFEILFHWVRVE